MRTAVRRGQWRIEIVQLVLQFSEPWPARRRRRGAADAPLFAARRTHRRRAGTGRRFKKPCRFAGLLAHFAIVKFEA